MWIRFAAPRTDAPAAAAPEPPPAAAARRRGRRAATSMEYAVMLSFILLVVIAGVQSFGVNLGRLFTADAIATSKTQTRSK